MGSKYRYVLSILQIVVGILAAMVFIKTIAYGGKVELKLISLMAMILGVANGVRGIREINKH
ncbi:hypothetical protein C5Q96_00585 [Mogibacterium diversum]|uniref:Uncharacterized protein n=1 Tax=Mogibacterium diversum TaxID=114527 RepID=A0A2S0L2B8_9FIRM|nr:hypothetical protein [Mogibacterium diversum]AVM47438.1 hypothetical protein C5Q96_00585 [Mogibacterium diversum]